MIGCERDTCEKWFHTHCLKKYYDYTLNMVEEARNSTKWLCPKCVGWEPTKETTEKQKQGRKRKFEFVEGTVDVGVTAKKRVKLSHTPFEKVKVIP
eukprot:UN27575